MAINKAATVPKAVKPAKPGYRIYDVADEIKKHRDRNKFKDVIVQTKIDGIRILLVKEGNEIRCFSEDELYEKTDRMGPVIKDARKIPKSCVLDGEMVLVKGGKLQYRAEVAGYLNAKKKDTSKGTPRLYVFDVLFWDGEDIRSEPLSERLEVLKSLPSMDSIVVFDKGSKHTKQPSNLNELESAAESLSKEEGSEGVVIKDLSSKYGTNWAKYKTEWEVDCLVVEKRSVQKNVWTYGLAVGPIDKEFAEKSEKEIPEIGKQGLQLGEKSGESNPPLPAALKYNNRYWMVVGRAFNTSINCSIGDTLRVAAQDIIPHDVKDTELKRYGIFLPRPIEKKSGSPDKVSTLKKLAEQSRPEGVERHVAKLEKANQVGVMLALKPQDHIKDRLAVNVDEPSIESVNSDELHVTLVYLGHTSSFGEDKQMRLFRAIEGVANRVGPFQARLNGITRFTETHKEDKHALVLNVDSPALPEFRQRLIDTLHNIGFDVEDLHGFTPHMTLAYMGSGVETPELDLPDEPLLFDSLYVFWGDAHVKFPLDPDKALDVDVVFLKQDKPEGEPYPADKYETDSALVSPRSPLKFWAQFHWLGMKEKGAPLADHGVHMDLRLQLPGGKYKNLLIEWVLTGKQDKLTRFMLGIPEDNPQNCMAIVKPGAKETGELISKIYKAHNLELKQLTRSDMRRPRDIQGILRGAKDIVSGEKLVFPKNGYWISPDSPVNSTKSWFFMQTVDIGTWKAGVQRKDAHEYFLDGVTMKGKFVFRAISNPSGDDYWLGTRPKDQTALDPEKHDDSGNLGLKMPASVSKDHFLSLKTVVIGNLVMEV